MGSFSSGMDPWPTNSSQSGRTRTLYVVASTVIPGNLDAPEVNGRKNESRSVIPARITKKSRESGCDNSLLLLLGGLMYISFSSACFGKVDSDILVSMQTLDCYHRGDCTHADPGLLFLEDSITSFDLASETLLVTWKIETKFAEEDEEEQWGKLLRRNEWVC